MEHTTVSISLDRESLQQAVTYILEYLANTPPDMGQMDIGVLDAGCTFEGDKMTIHTQDGDRIVCRNDFANDDEARELV